MPKPARFGALLARISRAVGAQIEAHGINGLLVIGVSAITWGAGLLHPAAGYITAGVCVLVVAVLLTFNEAITARSK